MPAQAQRGQLPPVQPVIAQQGMVVTQEARASLIGAEVLKRGGNAVDAAVAVGFAMAVTYPRAGNIGGGGFMVIHLAKSKRGPAQDLAIDYRETAPPAAKVTPPAASQIAAQQMAANAPPRGNGRGQMSDNERQLNDYRNRVGPITPTTPTTFPSWPR